MKRINETAKIIPFMWMNKETKQDIVDELTYIKELGINAVMLESRVHSDFCGEKWFEEMDVVMDFARKNQMTVWILDDKSYPSGSANGIYTKLGEEYKAHFIIAKRVDVVGESKNVKIIIKLNSSASERLVGTFLCKRAGRDCFSSIKNVAEYVKGDLLYIDIPDGEYSIISLIDTTNFAEREYYLDMLSSRSVDKFIDTIYESHYQRYKDDFGKTFMGFFSDEPRFANGRYLPSLNYKHKIRSIIGEFGNAYPWSGEVERSFFDLSDVLALWFTIGEKTAEIRCRYMEFITDVMASNFPKRLSTWCSERNVCYAGHIIEDNGNHTSLGCSLGHYFKSQRGANMASVDIVLHQIKPYDNDIPHFGPIAGGYGYPSFFNYTLLKLASSCARLDAEKQGNALCEVFGAYGWGESTNDMLYLVNLCIAQGINYFIPHAFSHHFGLEDCPPHFYAGGKYSITDHHKLLFKYMNKLTDKFSGGEAEMDYAVLYHAQAEWSGNNFSAIDDVMKILSDYQLGADIVDFSYLKKAKSCVDGIIISNRKYKKLICPYFENMPEKYKSILDGLGDNVMCLNQTNDDFISKLLGCVPSRHVGLHILNYEKNGQKYSFVFNGGRQPVTIRNDRKYRYAVDYIRNQAYEVKDDFVVEKGQAVVLQNTCDDITIHSEIIKICDIEKFDVLIKKFDDIEFLPYKNGVGTDFDINSFENLPSFSGAIKYSFEIKDLMADKIEIDYDADGMLLIIGENQYASIGGKLGCFLTEMDKLEGKVEILLLNSFAYHFKDRCSEYNFIAPTKLNRVTLYKKA